MSEESPQQKVNDVTGFRFSENEDTIWRSLRSMFLQNLLQHFHTFFWLQLFLYHSLQKKITYGKKCADFFIRKLFGHTVIIVDTVEFQHKLVYFIDIVSWTFLDGIQSENLRKNFSFFPVGPSFSKIFCLILV